MPSNRDLLQDWEWQCVMCHKDFIDPENCPAVSITQGRKFEARLYWLGLTEPVCAICAMKAGIPPIDKE